MKHRKRIVTFMIGATCGLLFAWGVLVLLEGGLQVKLMLALSTGCLLFLGYQAGVLLAEARG